jgi:hypothetical protein
LHAFPLILLVSTLAASALGLMGIAWCRCERTPHRARWGRRLYLLVLGVLGGGGLLLAWQPHHGLLYLGLAVGLLVIAMLWEGREAKVA